MTFDGIEVTAADVEFFRATLAAGQLKPNKHVFVPSPDYRRGRHVLRRARD